VAKKEKKMELLQEFSNLIMGVGATLWDLAVLLLAFALDMGKALHEHPFIEGLTVGLGSAWALDNRDKNIVTKVLSTPLKLVLDALNYVGGQLTRLSKGALSMAKKPFTWLSGGGKWLYESVKGGLASLKAKFSRTKD
jgi:hypothetical protein